MPMQKSAGDAPLVLLAPREILVGSKRSAESHQPSGVITDAGEGALIKGVTAATFPMAVPSLRAGSAGACWPCEATWSTAWVRSTQPHPFRLPCF